jgi:hypothetical protein
MTPMAKPTAPAPGISCWFKRTTSADCEWEEGIAYSFEAPCSGSLAPVAIVSAAYDGATLPIHLTHVALIDEHPDQLKERNEKAAAEKAEKAEKERLAAEEKAAKAEAKAEHEAAHHTGHGRH